MAFDKKTGQVFLPTANVTYTPATEPGAKPVRHHRKVRSAFWLIGSNDGPVTPWPPLPTRAACIINVSSAERRCIYALIRRCAAYQRHQDSEYTAFAGHRIDLDHELMSLHNPLDNRQAQPAAALILIA